jgi:hypothetical protein
MTGERKQLMIDMIGELWSMSPEIRLGQLLAHLGFLGAAHLGRNLGTFDDDDLLRMLDHHNSELAARTADRVVLSAA